MGDFALASAIAQANSQTVAGNKAGGVAGVALAAFARGGVAALLGSELPSLPNWSQDAGVCEVTEVTEVAEAPPRVSRQREIALDLMRRSRRGGLPFSFIAVDGGYGHLPWLPAELARAGETFLAEMHSDRAIYLDDPGPSVPVGRSPLLRASLRLRDKVAPTSIVAWTSVQSTGEWQRLVISDAENPKRKLRADYLTRRVWYGKPASVDHWHLLVRREMDGETLKFCLSNAAPDASLRDLAEMLGRASWSREPEPQPRARTVWHW